MKRATCGKSGVAKSPSISFRLVGRKKGRGVVFRAASSCGAGLDGIACNGPTSAPVRNTIGQSTRPM